MLFIISDVELSMPVNPADIPASPPVKLPDIPSKDGLGMLVDPPLPDAVVPPPGA